MKLQFALFAALICAASSAFAAPVTVSGRVLDENGAGASGAWVTALEADGVAAVRADENGAFTLRDIPLEKFTILAASGFSYMRVAASALAATPTELRLRTPPIPDNEALAARALEGDVEWWRMSDHWDVLGTARIVNLLDRRLALKGVNKGWAQGIAQDRHLAIEKVNASWPQHIADNLPHIAKELTERAPREMEPRAAALLENMTVSGRPEMEASINLARARSGDDKSRARAKSWLDEQKKLKRTPRDGWEVTETLQIVPIAVALGGEDADYWTDYATALALTSPVDVGQNDNWGRLAGPLGYENAARFTEVLKPVAEFYFWSRALREMPKNEGLAGKQRVLRRLEELMQKPELNGDVQPNWEFPIYGNPTQRINGARQFIAEQSAGENLARSLDAILAKDKKNWDSKPLLKIADRAIELGQLDVAERALRAALALTMINARDAGLMASLAERVSPELGAEFWPVVLERAQTGKESWRKITTIGMWAFYHARLDPAQSRILVEREWSWRLAGASREKTKDRWLDEDRLHCLQMGMAAVDPARALEMRDEAGAQLGLKAGEGKADVGLAAALLSSPAQRARMGAGVQF